MDVGYQVRGEATLTPAMAPGASHFQVKGASAEVPAKRVRCSAPDPVPVPIDKFVPGRAEISGFMEARPVLATCPTTRKASAPTTVAPCVPPDNT